MHMPLPVKGRKTKFIYCVSLKLSPKLSLISIHKTFTLSCHLPVNVLHFIILFFRNLLQSLGGEFERRHNPNPNNGGHRSSSSSNSSSGSATTTTENNGGGSPRTSSSFLARVKEGRRERRKSSLKNNETTATTGQGKRAT